MQRYRYGIWFLAFFCLCACTSKPAAVIPQKEGDASVTQASHAPGTNNPQTIWTLTATIQPSSTATPGQTSTPKPTHTATSTPFQQPVEGISASNANQLVEFARLEPPGLPSEPLALSGDGNVLAILMTEMMYFYRTTDLGLIAAHEFVMGKGASGQTIYPWALELSEDGEILVGAYDRVRRYHVRDGSEMGSFKLPGVVDTMSFSKDWHLLAVYDDDTGGGLYLYQFADGKQLYAPPQLPASCWSAALSPDGQVLAAGWDDGGDIFRISLWATDDLQTLLPGSLKLEEMPTTMTFSPDGKTLLWGTEYGRIGMLRGLSGRPLVLSGHAESANSGEDLLARINKLVYSPDGSLFASVSYDGTARLWNAEDGSLLTILEGHEGYVNGAAFSPAGDVFYTSGGDATLRLWGILE